MANKAKHAFGSSADVEAALSAGKINAYDILFLDGDEEPKVGWIDKNGVFRLVKSETDLSAIEAELANKVDAEEVDAKIENRIEEKIAEVNSAYEVVEF